MLRGCLVFVFALVLHSTALHTTTVEAEECLKNCGCGGIVNIGHRSCGGETDCHVTACSLNYYNGAACWSFFDTYNDVCGSDLGWECDRVWYHQCVYSMSCW